MIKYLCYSLLLMHTSVFAIERVVTSSMLIQSNVTTLNSSPHHLSKHNTFFITSEHGPYSPLVHVNNHSNNVLSNQFTHWALPLNSYVMITSNTRISSKSEMAFNPNRLVEPLDKNLQKLISGIDVSFQSGKISANLGLTKDTDDKKQTPRMYAQIGYSFIESSAYSVVGVVKVDNISPLLTNAVDNVMSYSDETYLDIKPTALTNTTLGIIGTYKVSPQLTILGSLTTTALGNEVYDYQLFEFDSSHNHALVGASYSF